MSPIKGLTDRTRLARIGKIHLGVKETSQRGTQYPRAVDYFVVKADDSTPQWAAEAFRAVYGDEPRELDIIFPADDELLFADVNYKMYTASHMLTCAGTGEEARAKWDLAQDGPRPEGVVGGTWANKDTQSWVWRVIPCPGEDCPLQQGERPLCRRVMNLSFLLPEVEGIGTWQLDTSSVHSVRALYDSLETIRAVTGGRVRGLRLKLRLAPIRVAPPGVKSKTVHVLRLDLPHVKLVDLLAEASRLPERGLMLPPPIEEDEPPEDLYPNVMDLGTGEALSVEEASEALALVGKTGVATSVESEQVGSLGDLLNLCLTRYGLMRDDVLKVLHVKEAGEIEDYAGAWAFVQANAEY